MKTTWKQGLLAAVSLVVPLSESLAGTADFTVQYQNYNAAAPNDNIIEAGIQLRNNTGAAIPLKNVVVRYWFTKNGATPTPACWWWNSPDCSALSLSTASVSATNADQYVEIRFNDAAGSLAAGATSSPIDLGITFGGTNVNEADDYSYGNVTAPTAWSKITVHDVGSAALSGLRGGTPPSGSTQPPPTVGAEFFDDFTYNGTGESAFTNLWNVRTYAGPPGVSGATWTAGNVSFVTDGSDRLLRLKAGTNGTSAGTTHTEVISRAQKFKYGTYATRIRFRDTTLSGPRVFGDKYVETFFAIAPYGDPNYSEQDYEYLPNGGWGQGNTPTMFLTSFDRNIKGSPERKLSYSHDGWHTLVLHTSPSGNVYHIDGVERANHPAWYAPIINQFLDFQMWFIELGPAGEARTYYEDVDWVYFAKDTYLDTNAVNAKVTSLRGASVPRKDTVP